MSDVNLTSGIGDLVAVFFLLVFVLLVAPAGVWIAARFGVRMPVWLRSTAKGFTLFFGSVLVLFVLTCVGLINK